MPVSPSDLLSFCVGDFISRPWCRKTGGTARPSRRATRIWRPVEASRSVPRITRSMRLGEIVDGHRELVGPVAEAIANQQVTGLRRRVLGLRAERGVVEGLDAGIDPQPPAMPVVERQAAVATAAAVAQLRTERCARGVGARPGSATGAAAPPRSRAACRRSRRPGRRRPAGRRPPGTRRRDRAGGPGSGRASTPRSDARRARTRASRDRRAALLRTPACTAAGRDPRRAAPPARRGPPPRPRPSPRWPRGRDAGSRWAPARSACAVAAAGARASGRGRGTSPQDTGGRPLDPRSRPLAAAAATRSPGADVSSSRRP